MNDLISRESLLKKYAGNRDFCRKIEAEEAVEAAPVRLGRWIEQCPGDIYVIPKCSNCGSIEYSDRATKYCSNCGARMDGFAGENRIERGDLE